MDSLEFQLHHISYYSMTFDCYRFYRERKKSETRTTGNVTYRLHVKIAYRSVLDGRFVL